MGGGGYLLYCRMQKKASKKTATMVSVIILVKLANTPNIPESSYSIKEKREDVITLSYTVSYRTLLDIKYYFMIFLFSCNPNWIKSAMFHSLTAGTLQC